jgi:hypothetical protein
MTTNILESMMNSFGGDFSRMASAYLGASEQATKAAMGSVFPSLLGAVVQQGSTPTGASSLMNAITSPSIATDVAGTMTKIFSGGPAADELINRGTSIAKALFGDKFSSVTEAAASASGLGAGAVEKMFALGAPLLFGALKNQVTAGKLDTSGLTALLEGQRDFVKAGIDSSLAGLLGLGGLFSGLTGALGKAFEAITDAGTSAIEEATKVAEKVAHLTGETARAAGEAVTKAAGVATEAGASAVSSAVKTAETVAVHSAEAAKSAGDIATKAAHVASEAGANALKTAETTANKVADAAKSAATAAAHAASNAVDAGTSAVAGAVRSAENLADATGEAARKAAETAKQAANTTTRNA